MSHKTLVSFMVDPESIYISEPIGLIFGPASAPQLVRACVCACEQPLCHWCCGYGLLSDLFLLY